ncbi:hypothetical protein [Photobacterium sp. GB-72]|uniref:hypothetical protein n=1 Tax=Photobacterium sp. GB-72 TaxID=2022105 RepID=UPI000D1693DC|nr:hypothetical protein [Photobacterium sp. GB-72]PSV32285.1 hypothetical protein C9J40_03655 [Photobacterium sp. GB-72]
MDIFNSIPSFGSFLLGAASAGLISYITSRNKEAGKIAEINSKLDDVIQQTTAISKANESGKIEAIGIKLDEVVKQQGEITKATKKIESDIDIDNWTKKENRSLRREKIELLYLKIEECYQVRIEFLNPRIKLGTEKEQIREQEEKHIYYYKLNTDIEMLIRLYFNADNKLEPILCEFKKNIVKTINFGMEKLLSPDVMSDPNKREEEGALQNEFLDIRSYIINYLIEIMKTEIAED